MEKLLRWCKERHITAEILNKRGITVEKHQNKITGATERRIVIPYFKGEEAVAKKYLLSFRQFHFDSDNIPLYNSNAFNDDLNDVLYLTDNEFNAVFISDVCGIQNVVALPFGYDINKNSAYIEQIRDKISKLVLVVELSEEGLLFSDWCISLVGIGKCAYVHYGREAKDILSIAKSFGVEEARKILQTPRDYEVPNIITFDKKRDEILRYAKSGIARGYSTGFSNLDKYYTLQPGSLNMLIGIPSAGKSQFVDAIILNTIERYKWRWCYYSPENLPVEFHFQKLCEMYCGRPMFSSSLETVKLTELQIENAIKHLSEHLYIIVPHENSLDIDDVLLKIKVCKQRYDINGFVIDPYNELEHTRSSHLSETEYVSQFLSKVRNFTRVNNLLAFIVVHPTKLQKNESGPNAGEYPVPNPYDAAGSAHWRNKCDNCLAIWRSYNTNNSVVQVHVQKVRNKNIGKLGVCSFAWDSETGRYIEKE